MLRHFKNEHGAALIVVLLTITLLMIFTVTISNQLITTAKQNEIVEQNNRATHLAEMGAKFIKFHTLNYLKTHEYSNTEEFYHNMEEELKVKVENFIVDEEFPERYFDLGRFEEPEITDEGVRLHIEIIGHDENFTDQILITFFINTGVESVEDWEDRSDTTPPPPEDPDYVFDGDVDWNDKGKNECVSDENGSFYVGGDVTITCEVETGDLYTEGLLEINNKNGLVVNGTAVLNGVSVNNQSYILIKGDAYIDAILTSYNNPNSEFNVCGNARFKQGIDYQGNFAVRGHVVADKMISFKGEPVKIGKNAILKKGIQLEGGDLFVGGDLSIYLDTDIQTFQNNLGGTLNLTGDLMIYLPNEDEPIINPSGDSFVYDAEPPVFPACEGVPESSNGSEFEVGFEDIEYS